VHDAAVVVRDAVVEWIRATRPELLHEGWRCRTLRRERRLPSWARHRCLRGRRLGEGVWPASRSIAWWMWRARR